MPVTRGQILARGLTHRCPNCGAKTLFQPGRLIALNRECPACGLSIEHDEGFFLGSMSLNYGVTLIFILTPVALLWYEEAISDRTAGVLALAGAVVFPALFYRSSRSWWLMSYYFFLPQQLPANRSGPPGEAGSG
jgi:uncharacterized protein (DUF983 family)